MSLLTSQCRYYHFNLSLWTSNLRIYDPIYFYVAFYQSPSFVCYVLISITYELVEQRHVHIKSSS